MVATFFDEQLKSPKAAPGTAEARTTESTASVPSTPAAGRGFPSFDEVLGRGDTNQDGKLSREEFRGPVPLFDRLDRNKDGLITRDEHEAARPPR
jgi:hypothetical protein